MSRINKLSNSKIQQLQKYYSFASDKQKYILDLIIKKDYLTKGDISFVLSFIRQCKKIDCTQALITDTHLNKVRNNPYKTSVSDSSDEKTSTSTSKFKKTLFIDSKGNKRYI